MRQRHKDIKNDINQISRNENYNIGDEKYTPDNRLDIVEEKIHEVEDIATEII